MNQPSRHALVVPVLPTTTTPSMRARRPVPFSTALCSIRFMSAITLAGNTRTGFGPSRS
jgi:hypothetical protein